MAVTLKAFGSFAESADKVIFTDLNGATDLKLMLTTGAPDQDSWFEFADVTSEIVDASYAAGGVALGTVVVAEAAKVVTIAAANTVFTALNKNFRYGVIYQDAVAKPLIAFVDYGSTLDVETLGPQDVTFAWPTGIVLTHTVA